MREDQRSALRATLLRIDELLEGTGRCRADVLDTERLSFDTGLPEGAVLRLLEGLELPEETLGERIRARFAFLRRTRRRADGSAFSFGEIASSFGASAQSIHQFVNSSSDKGPRVATAAGIESFFFGRANAFLSAEPAAALNDSLVTVVKGLQAQADPLAGVRAGALRAAGELPEEQWNVMQATLAALVRQVRAEQEDT